MTNTSPSKINFETKALCCVFLGYPFVEKAYKLYDLNTKKFFTSRDVQFHETNFPFVEQIDEPSRQSVQPIIPFPSIDGNLKPFLIEGLKDNTQTKTELT